MFQAIRPKFDSFCLTFSFFIDTLFFFCPPLLAICKLKFSRFMCFYVKNNLTPVKLLYGFCEIPTWYWNRTFLCFHVKNKLIPVKFLRGTGIGPLFGIS